MNLKEKYGEWGIILGATEGVGKAFCEKLAQGGMNIVMVGRREEKLNELGNALSLKYGVKHLVIKADFSEAHAAEEIFEIIKRIYVRHHFMPSTYILFYNFLYSFLKTSTSAFSSLEML